MQDHYGKHRLEPVWRATARLRRLTLPQSLRGWLLDPHSLTRRLQGHCGGRFSVRVLSQRIAVPMYSEAKVLGMAPRRLALIREVHLCCDGTPWVFARTVIPLRTLTGEERRLGHLGNRPLGAMLFRSPGMRRTPIEVTELKPRHRLYRMASGRLDLDGRTIHGRRSLFSLHGKSLLVSELFLPTMPLEREG